MLSHRKGYADVDHDHGAYVGLWNQGATCYMNAIIQSLFMTPEFRNAIFSFNDSNNKNLLLQLQKIFINLQIRRNSAISTNHFTASLGPGWNFKPFEQRDSHEFLRYIFDALGEIWLINFPSPIEFYRGTMKDFIKCSRCGNEECKDEPFLDISLAVRRRDGFGSFANINESLRSYFTPQHLDDDDPCEFCNSSRTLEKGFCIKQWPYILTLHLKRFDMNWQTKRRYKLNERIEFDEFLELDNQFGKEKKGEPNAMDGVKNVHSAAAGEDDKIIYFYELFAIIAHGGSSTGGHYFAYIKNLDDHCENKRWYCFNDSSVRLVSKNEVDANTFGTGANSYSCGSNAYVLMYRKIDEEQNQHFVHPDEFPHIKALKAKMEKHWLYKKIDKSSESAATITKNKKNNGKGEQKKINQQTNGGNDHSAINLTINNQNNEKSENYGWQHSDENIQIKYEIGNDGEKTTKTNKHGEDLIKFSDYDYHKMEMGEITTKYRGREIEQFSGIESNNLKMPKNRDLFGKNDFPFEFMNQSTSTICYQETIDEAEQISAAQFKTKTLFNSDSNLVIKNNGIETKKRNGSIGSKLLANNQDNYIHIKQQEMLTKIADCHALLTKCMQLNEELIIFKQSRKTGKNIQIQTMKLKMESDLTYEMNQIFGNSSAIQNYSILFFEQGRLLLTRVLHFYCKINKKELIGTYLARLVNLLPKLAEKCEQNLMAEPVKTFSDEICCNFDFYNSTILLMDQMKKMRPKPEMIKNSEFMQRALLALLCTAIGMNWKTDSPFQPILQIYSWAQLLSMPMGHLKFNPFKELDNADDGDQQKKNNQKWWQLTDDKEEDKIIAEGSSKKEKFYFFCSALYSMIYHNRQCDFEKESVAIWLANYNL